MDVKQPSDAFKPSNPHTFVKINSRKMPALPIHPYSCAVTKTNAKHNFRITVTGINSLHRPTLTTHKRSEYMLYRFNCSSNQYWSKHWQGNKWVWHIDITQALQIVKPRTSNTRKERKGIQAIAVLEKGRKNG